jgi:hypothetical protein
MESTQRVAIVLSKQLDKGRAGNVAAILMGQATLLAPQLYATEDLKDTDGHRHAAIRHSTVVLKANGSVQLGNFLARVRSEHPALTCIAFSGVGLGLHDAYPAYRERVGASSLQALEPVGVLVAGDAPTVRAATRRFSLMD